MMTKDIPQIYALLKAYLADFTVAPQLSQEEVAHRLVPKDGVNYSYVVENPETKKITDFVSFYRLSFKILSTSQSHEHTHINSAYL
jgi:glycylpeptide N-tetradecanoyltransferase